MKSPQWVTGMRERADQIMKLVAAARGWAERTIFWRVWDRMLENEFIDRGIALAAKAFVSFFPAVIVVAAFAPPAVRTAIAGDGDLAVGAAFIVVASACAAPVLAEDRGALGRLVRGPDPAVLVPGAVPSLGAPLRAPTLSNAIGLGPEAGTQASPAAGPVPAEPTVDAEPKPGA
jgi:hypothetical protein